MEGTTVVTRPKLLVTGGSGFLGGWVVRLARSDWRVTATYLTRPRKDRDASWRELDVRDESTVEGLIQDVRPSTVVHTAAINPGQGSAFEAVNTLGTRNVARAAARVGACLIHVSTDVLFDGKRTPSGGYAEQDLPSPITPYGRSKALAERALHSADARGVIVRTSLIYGPAATAEDAPPLEASWQQWDRQTRWVVGDLEAGKSLHLFTDEVRCPILVRSLASALLELAASNRIGGSGMDILHVAGAQPLTRYAFGLRLARFHGADPASIVPTLSRESGMNRPLDCTLDCSLARALLHTPLPGVDQALGLQAAEMETQS
jgi:dTDP-4-dehydrorhamnose reductase